MRQLTTERAMLIILFALLFAMAARIPTDTDTWWHIRSAEHTLTQGMIYADPFSFTRQGESWINHSWGSQIIIYGSWQIAGNLGLTVFTAALATAGMAFVYRISTGSVYLRAFVLVLGAATAAVFWSPRPQMLSFLLSTVVLYLLYLYKRRQVDRLWLIPVVMLIWANLHAGFSIGFIFMAAVMAGEILSNIFNPGGEHVIPWSGIRKLILIGLVSVTVLVVNPYGLDMLRVPFETVSIGALRDFIQEWNSPNFHERQTWPFIALLLGTLGAVGSSNRKLDTTDFILVSGTAFMAFLAGRNIAVFAVVATPVLTLHAEAILKERGWILHPTKVVTPGRARLNLILVAVILFAALAKVLLVLEPESLAEAQEQFLPIKVAEYLNDVRPEGPMFNSYNWGGYLMFAAPDYPVFVDGRTDLYRDDLLLQYLRAATGGRDWRETLDEFSIRLVVVEAGSGLALNLADDPAWMLDYEDEMAVVYTREDG